MGKVQVTRVGTQAVVRLSGDVDAGMATALGEAVEEVRALRPTRVAVDLDAVTVLEGVGVDFLVGLHRSCDESGWPLRLLEVPPDVRRCLDERAGAPRPR